MVGGAVRDALLGLPVQDRDWVVVGSTPEELVARGFLPVGKDFPVFLHPTTKEDYALARTERKTARGYHGFAVQASPDVTLEQDLARRDLTINSIATSALIDWASGQFGTDVALNPADLIDPFGGQQDIQAKVLRHVTDAFREDPVRILRVARFAARFADFSVAPETMQLMRQMVADGEADALVAERVWQELSRGLMQSQPSRMFDVLRACGALERLLPELEQGSDTDATIDLAARLQAPLAVRFACLTQHLAAAALKGLCERLRVPVDCRELADVVARERCNIQRSGALAATELVQLLEKCDAFRKPQRFADVLLACEYDARGHSGQESSAYGQRGRLLAALEAAQRVPTRDIAHTAQAAGLLGEKIGEKILAARVAAVSASLHIPA